MNQNEHSSGRGQRRTVLFRSANYVLTSTLLFSCGLDQKSTSNNPLEMAGSPLNSGASRITAMDETLLTHQMFQGYFQFDSVRRIVSGTEEQGAQVSEGGPVDRLIAQILKSIVGDQQTESLEMNVKSRDLDFNMVTQQITTYGGDKISGLSGHETQSGEQLIDWQMNQSTDANACHSQFLCAARIVWTPKYSTPTTYCYFDYETNQQVAIPYSPNPQFSGESFQTAVGQGLTSKAILVKKIAGNTSCQDANSQVLESRVMRYKVSYSPMEQMTQEGLIQVAVQEKLHADSLVVIQNSLFNPVTQQDYIPQQGPYVDQLTRLSSQMRYYLNQSEHVIAKMERVIQSPMGIQSESIVEYIRQMFGADAAEIARDMLARDQSSKGVQLTYAYEFCNNLSQATPGQQHCPTQR